FPYLPRPARRPSGGSPPFLRGKGEAPASAQAEPLSARRLGGGPREDLADPALRPLLAGRAVHLAHIRRGRDGPARLPAVARAQRRRIRLLPLVPGAGGPGEALGGEARLARTNLAG